VKDKMTTLYKWRIYCDTEQAWKYVWTENDTVGPSTCPENTNHAVASNSTSQIDELKPNAVEILEEATPVGAIPTGGFFQLISRAFDCPGNTTTSSLIQYPHPISIMGGFLNTVESMVGDIVTITAAEGITVGALTSGVNINDTVINVSPTVLANVVTGRRVSLTDGTNTTDYITVISKNTVAGTITLRTGSPYAFSAGGLIRFQIVYCDSVELGSPGKYEMGTTKIGGTYVLPNIPILVKYTNNGSTTKRPSFIITLLY
jgi:hypothetical protein